MYIDCISHGRIYILIFIFIFIYNFCQPHNDRFCLCQSCFGFAFFFFYSRLKYFIYEQSEKMLMARYIYPYKTKSRLPSQTEKNKVPNQIWECIWYIYYRIIHGFSPFPFVVVEPGAWSFKAQSDKKKKERKNEKKKKKKNSRVLFFLARNHAAIKAVLQRCFSMIVYPGVRQTVHQPRRTSSWQLLFEAIQGEIIYFCILRVEF